LIEEVRNLVDYYETRRLPTNLKSGILLCVKKCASIALNEHPGSVEDLKLEIERLKPVLLQEKCFDLKVFYNSILELVGMSSGQDDTEIPSEMYHPSLKDWMRSKQETLDDPGEDLAMRSTEDGYRFIESLSSSSSQTPQIVIKFLQENIECKFLNGIMCVALFEYLLTKSHELANDPELLLDLLDIPTHVKIRSGEMGKYKIKLIVAILLNLSNIFIRIGSSNFKPSCYGFLLVWDDGPARLQDVL